MNKFFNLKVFLIFFVLMAIQSFRGLQKGIIEYPIIATLLNLTVVPLFFSFIYAFFFTKRPRQVGKKGYTRLMELCSKGDIEEIKKEFELLKKEINFQDDKGYSALVYSVLRFGPVFLHWPLQDLVNTPIRDRVF